MAPGGLFHQKCSDAIQTFPDQYLDASVHLIKGASPSGMKKTCIFFVKTGLNTLGETKVDIQEHYQLIPAAKSTERCRNIS